MAQVTAALKSRPDARDDVDRLRQRIDDLRGDIGNDVYELESRVRQAFDLRRQIARHPVVTAVVVLAGVLVATRVVRSLLRGVRTPGANAPPGLRSREARTLAHGQGREAFKKEVPG